jgi:hypothetical protein
MIAKRSYPPGTLLCWDGPDGWIAAAPVGGPLAGWVCEPVVAGAVVAGGGEVVVAACEVCSGTWDVCGAD